MNNTMEYKGYLGSVEFSEEDALFYGQSSGHSGRDFITREATLGSWCGFPGAVDDYLELCAQQGKEPGASL